MNRARRSGPRFRQKSGVDVGDVQFVGCGQFGTVLSEPTAGGEDAAGEPVPEPCVNLGQARVGGVPVAAGVYVHELFGLGTDHRGQFTSAVDWQQARGKAVGSVERVAQAGQLQRGASAPRREPFPYAYQVCQERPARVVEGRGVELAKERDGGAEGGGGVDNGGGPLCV